MPALHRHITAVACLVICAGLLGACARGAPAPPRSVRLGVETGLPAEAVAAAQQALVAAGVEVTQVTDSPDVLLSKSSGHSGNAAVGQSVPQPAATSNPAGGALLVYEDFLVPIDRFSTLLDGVSLDTLARTCQGQAPSPDFTTIYAATERADELSSLLGPPSSNVRLLPAPEVAGAVWQDPLALGILPFDTLEPRVRALRLDGLSAVDNRLEAERWPLTTRAWLRPASARGTAVLRTLPAPRQVTNRDPQRLTVLTMTGTTALARGTAAAIEESGDFAFPARQIGPDLAAADITTMSNEASFVDGCVADNRHGVATFCARPEYFATLELSGIRLVGLTGNHLNDFGTANFLKTLDLYKAKGLHVYGGGANDEAARAPLIVEHHGNRLAFLGANQFGPGELYSHDGDKVSAWAGATTPGSATYNARQMASAVSQAKRSADLVFAELQWLETNENDDYQVEPVFGQRDGFRALAEAGADVVTGMQAHAPQAVELRGSSLILYGLGNLYFDQTWSLATRTGLVARHTIYNHRLLNTELLVIYIQDDMQVRWATPSERAQVLLSVFSASTW